MALTPEDVTDRPDVEGYCRAIETYLCRKNDGHLIRLAGPGFDLVRGWAEQGIPLKVAFSGIDRTFERYYRRGPRRRPVQIAFCEADVLDAFDEWRRALGPAVAGAAGPAGAAEPETAHTPRAAVSLPAHLDRVADRLTMLSGTSNNEEFEQAVAGALREIDAARGARQFRGAARRALIARLAALDEDLLGHGRRMLPPDAVESLAREARQELSPYAERMDASTRAATQAALHARLIREAVGLPVIRFAG
jgi:hypothetical protein